MSFDTQYNRGLSGACGGLGACGGERAERERRSNLRNDIRDNQIPALRRDIEGYKTGEKQHLYDTLEKEMENIRKAIAQLKVYKIQAIKVRDMWRDNPEEAAASGLSGWFTRIFSCGHYEQDIKEINEEIGRLEYTRGELQRERNILSEKLSPKKTSLMQQEVNTLKQEKNQLEIEIASLKKETANFQAMRQARQEAERLALEQKARDEQARQEKELQKGSSQGSSKWIIWALIAAGAYVAFSKSSNKTTIVKV